MIAIWIIAAFVLVFGFVAFWGAPYVPSRRRDIAVAFDELYPLQKADVLVDIGSGDGVVLREAAKRGAKAVGYELNPVLVYISRFLSRKQKNISVKLANFWRTRLPDDVTVVYTFGDSRDIRKMAEKVSMEATRLKRPIAFISYGFAVPHEQPLKSHGAYFLYEFSPLQDAQAQV